MELRSERLELRLSPTEQTMLRQLAEDAGVSAADILRTLMRAEHRRRFGRVATPSKKTKGR